MEGGRALALAAAPLGLVVADRLGLDIALVRQGHHHVLGGDQVLQRQVRVVHQDLGAAGVAELVADRRSAPRGSPPSDWSGSERISEQGGDLLQDLLELLEDLLLLQAR